MGINHEGEDMEVYRTQEVGTPLKPRTRDPRVGILGGGAVRIQGCQKHVHDPDATGEPDRVICDLCENEIEDESDETDIHGMDAHVDCKRHYLKLNKGVS